ncbi:aminoglycoside phosphotransferase family protein [Roseivivax sediminis]|uniref:Aminoglycoside phosphotransferase domain-containing protein n=1 Tax=Roseivivax sediminis TaxID=936889 RepID=A0A1I1UJK6_9RHOB|nr:phosphotransferase [Roseivivax sediminis]SFD68140.1 hypothetical protein SAMN04515678_102260 [Roseivivax sediminis]
MSAFLDAAGWGGAAEAPLAGDASTRRYTRLLRDGKTAILMEDADGDVSLFARIAEYLRAQGLSAPGTFAMDAPHGLLLIEDLGDALFARICAEDPAAERDLYIAATDVLIALHAAPPAEGLTPAGPHYWAGLTDLAFDWYAAQADPAPAPSLKGETEAAFATLLSDLAPETEVTVLRDYHAENLLWLPERDGVARAGLLDFQDALLGHRAYDLVSLLEDARRDVTPATAEACIAHYLSATGQDAARFRAAYAALGAQRNLRLLGVFARLAAVRGRTHYVDLIPRVWRNLMGDLAHPALAPVAPLVTALPAPAPDLLQRLKSCPTP